MQAVNHLVCKKMPDYFPSWTKEINCQRNSGVNGIFVCFKYVQNLIKKLKVLSLRWVRMKAGQIYASGHKHYTIVFYCDLIEFFWLYLRARLHFSEMPDIEFQNQATWKCWLQKYFSEMSMFLWHKGAFHISFLPQAWCLCKPE